MQLWSACWVCVAGRPSPANCGTDCVWNTCPMAFFSLRDRTGGGSPCFRKSLLRHLNSSLFPGSVFRLHKPSTLSHSDQGPNVDIIALISWGREKKIGVLLGLCQRGSFTCHLVIFHASLERQWCSGGSRTLGSGCLFFSGTVRQMRAPGAS